MVQSLGYSISYNGRRGGGGYCKIEVNKNMA